MSDATDALARLHSRLIDACEGYAEGRDLAESARMTALFDALLAMHRGHSAEIAQALIARGGEPRDDGTFLQYVHKAVLNVRSALTGLQENVIPGLRDGEGRIVELYDDTRERVASEPEIAAMLDRQRSAIVASVARFEAMERAAKV